MRTRFITMLAVAGSIALAGPVVADEVMTKGVVTKVDEAQGKISINHDPIKKFDMDAMTMIFKAGDPAMIKAVKVGDKVQFHLDKVNGQFTLTKIEKAK